MKKRNIFLKKYFQSLTNKSHKAYYYNYVTLLPNLTCSAAIQIKKYLRLKATTDFYFIPFRLHRT